MAIFRKVHISFWSDIFIQSLSPEKKFFFLYLLTNEKTKQCGIYEISKRHISYDTGYNIETVTTLINYFISCGKILFSEETNEIAIKNWNRYNGSKSPDVKSLVDKELGVIKNKKLIEWLHSVDTVIPQSKSSSRQEPEPEEEPEPEKTATTAAVDEIGMGKVKIIANEVWKDQLWKEQLCQGISITVAELKKWMAQFNSTIAGDTIHDFNNSRYKRMLRGWIVKQQAKGIKVETGIEKTSDSAPLKRL